MHSMTLQTCLAKFMAVKSITADRLANETGVPKTTLVNWLKGKSKHPRYYDQLLRIAIYLNLAENETNQLLNAAGHPTLQQLQKLATGHDLDLFTHWLPPAPFQAPHEIPHFVGREDVLNGLGLAVNKRLVSQTPNVVVLHGMAGVGKTSLAVRMAHQLRAQFPEGVLWGQFIGQSSEQIALKFGRVWEDGLEEIWDVEARNQRIRNTLRNKRLLIVLDNVSTDAELRPLLALCDSKSAILVTTRTRELHTLRWAKWIALEPFANESESLALFQELLGSKYVRRYRSALVKMAHTAEHWPLALDLLASRLRLDAALTPAVLYEALQEQAVDTLALGDQSLRRTLTLIFDNLSEAERHLLCIVSLIPGSSFTKGVITHLSQQEPTIVPELLQRLYDYHLLYDASTKDEQRYRLHPFVRDFAIAQHPHPEQIVPHIGYYYLVERAHERGLNNGVEPDLDNILATFAFVQDRNLDALFVQGCILNHNLLKLTGYFALSTELLNEAAHITRQQEDWENLQEIVGRQGIVAERQGKYQTSYDLHHESLALARQLDTPEKICGAYQSLGSVVYRLGDIAQSELYFREALKIALQLDDAFWIVTLCQSLASVSWRLGKLEQAANFCQQGIELAIQTEDWDGAAQNWSMLATVYDSQNDLLTTQACLEKAWEYAAKINDQNHMASLQIDLADVSRKMGNFGQAEDYLWQSLQTTQQFGNQDYEARVRLFWARLAVDQQDYEVAVAQATEGLVLTQLNGHRPRTGALLRYLGLAKCRQGLLDEAKPLLDEAWSIAETLGDPAQEASIWLSMGEWYWAMGEKDRAQALFERCFEQCAQYNLLALQAEAEQCVAFLTGEH